MSEISNTFGSLLYKQGVLINLILSYISKLEEINKEKLEIQEHQWN